MYFKTWLQGVEQAMEGTQNHFSVCTTNDVTTHHYSFRRHLLTSRLLGFHKYFVCLKTPGFFLNS